MTQLGPIWCLHAFHCRTCSNLQPRVTFCFFFSHKTFHNGTSSSGMGWIRNQNVQIRHAIIPFWSNHVILIMQYPGVWSICHHSTLHSTYIIKLYVVLMPTTGFLATSYDFTAEHSGLSAVALCELYVTFHNFNDLTQPSQCWASSQHSWM